MSEPERFVLRTATGEDLQAVIEVGHRTWPATYGPIAGEDYVEMGLAKWWTQEATIPAIRAGRVVVAEVDGQVVGMTSSGPDGDALVLWKLYVLPEHQAGGIGRALLAEALRRAQREGYRSVRLSYLDGNDRAARFYHRNGFEDDGRESGGTGLPDSIWVSHPVGAHPVDARPTDTGTHGEEQA